MLAPEADVVVTKSTIAPVCSGERENCGDLATRVGRLSGPDSGLSRALSVHFAETVSFESLPKIP